MNLFARPAGGLISDRIGRKLTMSLVMVGIMAGYGATELHGQSAAVGGSHDNRALLILRSGGMRRSLRDHPADQTPLDRPDCGHERRLRQCW